MPKVDNKTKKAQVQKEESSSEEEEEVVVATKKVKGNVGTAKVVAPKGKAVAKKVASDDESSEEEEVIKPQPAKGKVAQKAGQKADQKNKKQAESDSDTSSDEDLKKAPAKKGTVATTTKAKAPAKKVESEEDSDEEEPVAPKKKAAAAPAQKAQPAKGKKPVAKVESEESSEEETPKAKTQAVTKAPAKAPAKGAAAKKAAESSEESSEEDARPIKAPKGQAKPAAKPVAGKKAAQIDDEVSDSDEAPKGKTTKQAVKPAAGKKPVAKEESSEEESSEEEVKPVKGKAQPAKAAAKKIEEEDDEEEEEEEPVKAKATATTNGFNKAQGNGADAGAKNGSSHEVIVKGLPWSASENDVAEHFSGCNGYESLNLLKGPDGRSKGIAFVRFTSEQGVNEAVALNNTDMGGRYLVVEKTVPKDQRAPAGAGFGAKGGAQDFGQKTQRDPNSSSIFIGNLSYQTTEDSLRSLFESCGEIYGCRIAMDQETGRPRGFAHVDFTSPDAVDKAIALAGSDLDGRQIRVDFSAGKKQDGGNRGGFGGGGRGGFGGGGRGGFGGGFGGGRAPGQGQRMNLDENDAAKKKGSISSFSGQKQRL